MIVQIFPDICPEKKRKNRKTKKVDDLELDFARFGSIGLDFNQIVNIFSDIYIYPRKNEKTKKVNHLELDLVR